MTGEIFYHSNFLTTLLVAIKSKWQLFCNKLTMKHDLYSELFDKIFLPSKGKEKNLRESGAADEYRSGFRDSTL